MKTQFIITQAQRRNYKDVKDIDRRFREHFATHGPGARAFIAKMYEDQDWFLNEAKKAFLESGAKKYDTEAIDKAIAGVICQKMKKDLRKEVKNE